MYASPYFDVIIRGRRADMVQLMSISGADERRDFDEYFDHDNDEFDHELYYKGGLFTMI